LIKSWGAAGGALFIESLADTFGVHRRQKIFAGHDFPASRGFEFQAGAFGDLAARLRGDLIFNQAGGNGGLGNLSRGEFGEGGKDEFRLAHVIAEVLGLDALQFLWAWTLKPLHSW